MNILSIIVLIAFAIVWIPAIIIMITSTEEDKKRVNEKMKETYPNYPYHNTHDPDECHTFWWCP
jgi:hypothetical protein